MADTHEESSEDYSDSTLSDNFSIYTETSSSEEDLQNVEEPGTSTSSATMHNSCKGKSKSSSKQPTVKRSKQQQSFFAGKAYLKIDSLVKTLLHEFMAVARSGLSAPVNFYFMVEDMKSHRNNLPLKVRCSDTNHQYHCFKSIKSRDPF